MPNIYQRHWHLICLIPLTFLKQIFHERTKCHINDSEESILNKIADRKAWQTHDHEDKPTSAPSQGPIQILFIFLSLAFILIYAAIAVYYYNNSPDYDDTDIDD
jgi:hypothetical protein